MIDLKLFRKENNLSQTDIGRVLDVEQPYISAIENGKRPLSKSNFNILYKHFGDMLLKYKRPDIIIMQDNTNVANEPEIKYNTVKEIKELKAENETLKLRIQHQVELIEFLREKLKTKSATTTQNGKKELYKCK